MESPRCMKWLVGVRDCVFPSSNVLWMWEYFIVVGIVIYCCSGGGRVVEVHEVIMVEISGSKNTYRYGRMCQNMSKEVDVLVQWNAPLEVLGSTIQTITLGQSNGAGKLIGQEVSVMVVRDVKSDVVRIDDVDGEWDSDGDTASGDNIDSVPVEGAHQEQKCETHHTCTNASQPLGNFQDIGEGSLDPLSPPCPSL